MNYVTYPGVALTAACFAHGRYEDSSAVRCLSNLLATGFRRIDVDLYWDASRGVWSLCPVELGQFGEFFTTSSGATSDPTQVTSLASISIPAKRNEDAASIHLVARQVSSHPTPSSASFISTTRDPEGQSLTTSLPTNPTSSALSATTSSSSFAPPSNNGNVFRVGPYSCTPTTDLQLLVGIFSAYVSATETDLNATTLVLTMNMHAASSASDPAGSAQAPATAKLPKSNSLLSSILAANTSAYIYTPTDLATQRSNLNASGSWFSVPHIQEPNAAFFEQELKNGDLSTPDGWPSESFVELSKAQRVFLVFGNIDPQMTGYNFSGDAGTIFPAGYLQSSISVTSSSGDQNSNKCFFNSSTTSISGTNSSWAISALGSGAPASANAVPSIFADARNLVSCGISPILNGTLNNVTADESFSPYQSFVQQTIWSWTSGEPTNASSSTSRCAALNSSSGFWQVADCTDTHHGACHVNSKPYQWRISSSGGPYNSLADTCADDNTTFDVPRIALENAYLLAAWRGFQKSSSNSGDSPGELLWINLNEFDVPDCWVLGQNSTCPYQLGPPNTQRQVVVPTVAAVIVFILAVLTVLVKCAGNRKSSKRRRRRGDDGWDYEGVPS